jgi:hypothetical protein
MLIIEQIAGSSVQLRRRCHPFAVRDARVPGFHPSNRVRRSLAGAALALLVAVVCAPASARAGCHRNGDGRPSGIGPTLENLQSIGALADSRGLIETPAPLGDRRQGCTGPFCSSNADPVSSPPSIAPVRLKAEWLTIATPPPSPDPTAVPAAAEGRAAWSNPPLADVFHPPRRIASVG